jgi:hypothetical protein
MKIKHLRFDTQSLRFRGGRPLAFATALASAALATLSPISAKAANPYFAGAPLNFTYAPLTNAFGFPLTNAGGNNGTPHSFGQAASLTHDGKVLSGQFDSAGINQIYISDAQQNTETCLTCGSVPGPNGVPQERPNAAHDWILFESYGAQPTHFGNAGLGGYGGDLYVMPTSGSGSPYRLTFESDPAGGAPYTATTGTPYDNFHAYWSPDGNRIVWTHLEATPLPGGQKWEIMVGDFKVIGGVPSLQNVTVVGLPYGAYETQPWSPDNLGFIFFASGGRQSPFQPTSSPPGWGNSRIYYMRVCDTPGGALLSTPMVTQLTDNLPFYAEQAVFTPDMQDVIMMSNRADGPLSWARQVMSGAFVFPFDSGNTGATQTLQFLADFEGPDFTSDLYLVDITSPNSKPLQRLTWFNNPPGLTVRQVVPEFYWNANYSKLIWTVESPIPAYVATYTGSFSGAGIPAAPASSRPTWIQTQEKAAVWANVGGQLQSSTPSGLSNHSAVPTPPSTRAPAFPHASSTGDNQTLPNVATTYIAPWQTDLTTLGNDTLQNLALPGLARLIGF